MGAIQATCTGPQPRQRTFFLTAAPAPSRKPPRLVRRRAPNSTTRYVMFPVTVVELQLNTRLPPCDTVPPSNRRRSNTTVLRFLLQTRSTRKQRARLRRTPRAPRPIRSRRLTKSTARWKIVLRKPRAESRVGSAANKPLLTRSCPGWLLGLL